MTQLLVTCGILVVLLVPGALLRSLLPLRGMRNPWSAVPLSVACGVLAMFVPSTIAVVFGTGMRSFALLLAAWSAVLAAAAFVAWRRRRGVRVPAIDPANRTDVAASACIGLLSLLAGAIAAVRGTGFQSDSAVHASIIVKLVELPGVRFDDLGLVPEGRPVDSAILPVWHHLLALGAAPFENPGIVAMWSAGAVVALCIPWAGAMLGWAAVRTTTGALLGATLTTALVIVPWGTIPQGAALLGYPGNLVIYVLLPALFAVLVECLDEHRATRRAALVAVALLTFVVAVLHLTYLYHVAVAAAGMALVALVLAPRVARRLMLPGVVVAGIAGVTLAASLPFLAHAEQFNRAGDEEWGGERVLKQWLPILDGRGNDIDPGYFLEAGGIALVGLLLALFMLPLLRGRNLAGAMLAVGPLLLLGSFARMDVVANFVSGLGSFPPIPRSYKVIPWIAAWVVLAHLCDAWLARRSSGRERLSIVVGVAGGLLVALLASAVPGHLLGRDIPKGGVDPLVPGWVFDAALVVLGVQLVVLVVLGWRRRGSAVSTPGAIEPPAPTSAAGLAAALTLTGVMAAVSVVGIASAWGDRPDRFIHAEGLFGTPVATDAAFEALRELPPGSNVFADEGAGVRMVAAAPVYVTHVRKQSFSTTERREGYLDVVLRTRDDEDRTAYLDEHDVDLVLLPLRPEIRDDLRRILGPGSGWEQVTYRGRVVGWRRTTGTD